MTTMDASAPQPPPGFSSWDELMALALDQARKGADMGEVPVGAVVVSGDGEILAQACNAPISSHDPTAHAEIRALRQAAARVGNYRLTGCTAVVTLEPCLMCLGAFIHARIGVLCYGASDPKSGAVKSRLDGVELDFVNHRFEVVDGIMAEECGTLLTEFFRSRR